MELMVAMAITTIIVTVLVSVTSIALDTWNRSRAELRASRQAKTMIDTMARDFESLVTRRGNKSEWLSAVSSTTNIGDTLQSTNAAKLIFFTAATDRYNGNLGPTNNDDLGGDVSCVAYEMDYKDPIGASGGTDFRTFVLNRKLVNPDETFRDLLGKEDLVASFSTYQTDVSNPMWFVCENVFQFSITFHVQVTQTVNNTTNLVTVPVIVGSNAGQTGSFKILGTGIEADYTGNAVSIDELKAGKITAMEVSVTVISDFGMDQLKRRTFTAAQQSQFLAENSYQYSKLVQLPSM